MPPGIDETAGADLSVVADDSDAPGCGCIGALGAPPLRWTCVRTWPQAERWAASNLRRQGFTAYLPLYTAQLKPKGGHPSRPVERPLFPGYLFVAHDPATSWGPIRDTPGVRSVVRSGNRIQYARAGAVEALQAGEAIRARVPAPGAFWRPGMASQLVLGAFQGQDAVVVAVDGKLATVTLLLFGALRDVVVPVRYLGPRP